MDTRTRYQQNLRRDAQRVEFTATGVPIRRTHPNRNQFMEVQYEAMAELLQAHYYSLKG